MNRHDLRGGQEGHICPPAGRRPLLIGLSRSIGNETSQNEVSEQSQVTCVLELVTYTTVQRTLFVSD